VTVVFELVLKMTFKKEWTRRLLTWLPVYSHDLSNKLHILVLKTCLEYDLCSLEVIEKGTSGWESAPATVGLGSRVVTPSKTNHSFHFLSLEKYYLNTCFYILNHLNSATQKKFLGQAHYLVPCSEHCSSPKLYQFCCFYSCWQTQEMENEF
jgi:hypothetical protein